MSNIILIDDDDALRKVLEILLKRLGHDVVALSGGEAILKNRIEFIPEVVLTDIFMPQGEGFETIRAIRQQHPQAHIIAMSGGIPGMEPKTILRWARALGADQALAKPFMPADLSLALENING